ncbi:MAG: multiheme c-type cytochrome, partial [Planctomycetota bacterium]
MRTLLVLFWLAALASAQARNLHPAYPLLDKDGNPVANQPVSPMATCGKCHDTEYIASHGYHARALGGFTPYSYDTGDLEIEAKVKRFGARHVGGGPAAALGVELNCFLCHIPQADNASRISELEAGRFAWAATATLAKTGLFQRTDKGWRYTGPETVELVPRDPPSENCGFCHGPVHTSSDPFVFEETPYALTRGRVFSPQRLADSGMNIAGKADQGRPFDVHAERLVRCSNCHFAPNNPAYRLESKATRPKHLTFDARRSSIDEYLKRPNHDFARGRDDSMRRCADCHDAEGTHDWLPQLDVHLRRVSCEACHIPHVPAPAARVIDWTVDDPPLIDYRGVDGAVNNPASLVTGWEPTLLENDEGQLAPYNVVTVRYWEDGGQPLALGA